MKSKRFRRVCWSIGIVSLIQFHPLFCQNNGKSVHLKYEVNNNYILFTGFAVEYSFEYNIPLVTYHELCPSQITSHLPAAKRRSSFSVYEFSSIQHSATSRDYKGSGYDRGHMVPAGDFYWDQALKDETFNYINISPQNPILNRGKWAYMEDKLRSLVASKDECGYVVTGCILYQDSTIKIGSGIGVPNFLFKLILFPENEEVFAFLFSNMNRFFEEDLSNYQVSVDVIERITKMNFFELLDDQLENRIESIIFELK